MNLGLQRLHTVTYSQVFRYTDLGGHYSPVLQVGVRALTGQDAIEVDAFIDSGASESLFDGSILQGIGLSLLDGRTKTYQSTAGAVVEARLHPIRLDHEELGNFALVVGFSTGPLKRNLLGRDFFNLIQIGFRAHEGAFFIEPTP